MRTMPFRELVRRKVAAHLRAALGLAAVSKERTTISMDVEGAEVSSSARFEIPRSCVDLLDIEVLSIEVRELCVRQFSIPQRFALLPGQGCQGR